MSTRWQYSAAAFTFAASLMVAASASVAAHGFGARYDLPFPLQYYLAGAGAAVALSFVIMGLAAGRWDPDDEYPVIDVLRGVMRPIVGAAALAWTVRLVGILAFVLVLIAGFYGTSIPSRNISVVIIWVLFWVGLAFSSALIGNVWALLNPWDSIFRLFERAFRLFGSGQTLSVDKHYPVQLGYWPAFTMVLLFAWIESAFTGSSTPKTLAMFVSVYSLVTFAGMFVYGRRVWLRQGEAFTALFGLLARFSPTEIAVSDPSICQICTADCQISSDICVDCFECYERSPPHDRSLYIRPYAAGLRAIERISTSQMAIILIVLATVSFDGFTATSTWVGFFDGVFPGLDFLGSNTATAVNTLGLALMIGSFTLMYLVVIQSVILASGEDVPADKVARVFVLSLVPIALAYHLAHFFSFLLIQGQLIIPMMSDPLGRGWDLFGTADYVVDLTIVNARVAWLFSVTAIVIGHIVAVYLAHLTALKTFDGNRAALRSQYPMLLLMVGYTMISLWILAQPIVSAE